MIAPLIPVKVGVKAPPYLEAWQQATPEDLETAIKQYPGCNLALRLDHYLALDPDCPEAINYLKDLEKQGKLPPTLTWDTWRKYPIRLYQRPDGLQPLKNLNGMALELRTGPGQYVLIPDSTVNGQSYQWQKHLSPDDVAVAALPLGTLSLLKRLAGGNKEGQRIATPKGIYADLWRGISKGHRNDTATKLAGRLLSKGHPQDEALAILLGWNRLNSPPLSEQELANVVSSIAKAESRKGNLTCFSADYLLSQDLQAPPNIISNGVLPEGCALILAGESGVGKSLIALEIAIRLAHGLDIWNLSVPSFRRVLIIQAENPEHSVRFRLKRILSGLNLVTANDIILAARSLEINLSNQQGRDKLLTLIERHNPDVAILDPLSSYHRGNENDNIVMRAVLDTFTRISRDTGAAWIVVHHHGKPQEGLTRYRGASSIRDWCDTMISISEKSDRTRNLFALKFDKIRHGRRRPAIVLERDSHFCHEVVEEDSICPPPRVAEILESMGGYAKKGKLAKQIREIVGCAEGSAYRFIDNAFDRGLIDIVTEGNSKIVLLSCSNESKSSHQPMRVNKYLKLQNILPMRVKLLSHIVTY